MKKIAAQMRQAGRAAGLRAGGAAALGCVLAAGALGPSAAWAADWKPVEQVETYSIKGRTGIALYRSIGERGPQASLGRAIAYTDFKLTWTRDYQRKDEACVLVSARPKLVLTYKLPKPKNALPPAVQASWNTFIEGVRRHERVHGDMVVEMVRKIEAASVGLSVADDPECRKIRERLTERLGELSLEQRQKSRDFDRAELSEGGNVHQLILRLANGP